MHVELSLSEVPDQLGVASELVETRPGPVEPSPGPAGPSLARWAAAVAEAAEPCLAVDANGVIVAVSPSCQDLLGLGPSAVGHNVLDGVIRLLDFSSEGTLLDESEAGKIPPLLALSSARLARGLLRVRCPAGACTIDAIATPLVDAATVTGSLAFFSQV